MSDEKIYNERAAESLNEASLNEARAGAVESLPGVVESPFCGSLRSKKFFMSDGLATEASHYLDSTEHCWCRETQMMFGPDGGRAHPSRCVPGRGCYASALKS